MLKKLLKISIILIITTLLINISYATEISMDLNNTINDSETTMQSTDNSIYSSEVDIIDTEDAAATTTTTTTTTTTDYEDSTDLSITNIINIVLIAVGIVLILLGIAIIIKLK